MEIELKSNRKFILYYTIAFSVFFSVLILLVFIGQMIGSWEVYEKPSDFWFIGFFIVLDIILILATFFTIFYKGKSYIFKNDSIEIYNHEKLIEIIKISDVERMDYYPYRFHYLITIFLGALPDGGAWKFHLYKNDNTKHLLGFIGEKDAYRIKELYPNIVSIMYERKRNR